MLPCASHPLALMKSTALGTRSRPSRRQLIDKAVDFCWLDSSFIRHLIGFFQLLLLYVTHTTGVIEQYF